MTITASGPVLIVDDNYHITQALSIMLGHVGIECIALNDTLSLLDIIDKKDPRVILLDVNMPGRDGLEVCREIRSNPKYDRVKIIMLTAMGSEEDLRRGFEAGADEYILKPFDPAKLCELLKACYPSEEADADFIDPERPVASPSHRR